MKNLVKSVEGDITIYTATGERITTPEQIKRDIGFDPEKQRVVKEGAKTYEGQQKGPDNKPVVIQMHSSFVELAELFTQEEKDYAKIANEVIQSKEYPAREYPNNKDELLATINLADLHIDKLDIKSTPIKKKIKMYSNAIEEILQDLDRIGTDKIVVANMGDFYNTDINSKTTKGTDQVGNASELDARHLGIDFIMDTLLKSQDVAPVEYLTTPGNHDEYKSTYLHTVILKALEQHPNIEVRPQANHREYVKRGNTLIGFMHGHTIKSKDVPMVMLNEASQNGIKFRIMNKGHSHQRQIENINGIEVNTMDAGGGPNTRGKNFGVDKSNYRIICDIYNKQNGKLFTKYQPVR